MKKKTLFQVLTVFVLTLIGINATAFAQQRGNFGNRLTGTYTLDTARSANVQRAAVPVLPGLGAAQAPRGLDSQDAERVRAALIRRLEAPQRMALDQNGRRVTIVSTSAPQVTIEADGRGQTETGPNGRTVTTTASMSGNMLTVNSDGDRGSDFSVSFDPGRN